MKKNILYISVMLLSLHALGQQREILITPKMGPNNEVTFQANNTDFCDYFVTINLTQLSNTSVGSNIQLNVRPGMSQILKLTPTRANEPVGFGFNYTYIKGNSNPKIDRSFVYLLPVKEGRSTNVVSVTNLKELFNKPVAEDWYALSFSMAEGDTVYSSRGGVVCNTIAGNSSPDREGTFYTRATNSVEIAHGDGTFAKYSLLKSSGILVKPGTRVNAGDPIGIVDKVYDRAQVYFMVYYLDKKLIAADNVFVKAGYSSVKPKIVLNETMQDYVSPGETYSAVKPVNVITQEMTKREKERFQSAIKK